MLRSEHVDEKRAAQEGFDALSKVLLSVDRISVHGDAINLEIAKQVGNTAHAYNYGDRYETSLYARRLFVLTFERMWVRRSRRVCAGLRQTDLKRAISAAPAALPTLRSQWAAHFSTRATKALRL